MSVQINEDQFSDGSINRFLCGEMNAEQSALIESRMDSCEDFARRVTQLAAHSWGWSEVTRSLADDEFDDSRDIHRSRRDCPSTATVAAAPTCQSEQAGSLLQRELSGWLDPTDDPNMLGRFAGYEIVGVVGHGGMGIVLKGFERALNRFVAIKVLAPRLAGNGAARKRFEREARAAAAVLHDNVIAIHRVDQWHGLPFLVMPYVAGESLQQRIDREGPLDLEATLRIAQQIAAGLAAAHAQGLVHRDIKPANILLDQGVERVTITDFGLARAADDAPITRTGFVSGTPMYMSPEQASAQAIDHRSDLFSLGSVMYSMATGVPPFQANENQSLLGRIRTEPAPDVREKQESVPEWLAELIDWCHAKSPLDRPHSAQEIERYLGEWLARLKQPQRISTPMRPAIPRTAQRARRPPRRWHRNVLAAFGGFLFMLAGIFITLETSKSVISIESEVDGVSIVIRKGDKLYETLTASRGSKSIRVFSGEYQIAITGDPEQVTLENDSVTLGWRDEAVVRIRENKLPATEQHSDNMGVPSTIQLTTWHDVKQQVASMVIEREQMVHGDVEFKSMAQKGNIRIERHYHVWFNGRNRRADCRDVSSDEGEHSSQIITPTAIWSIDHQDSSKLQSRPLASNDVSRWDGVIDVRMIGFVNRWVEALDSSYFYDDLLPKGYSNPRVELREQNGGPPLTVVKLDRKADRIVDSWVEFWLSPKHGNRPVFMAGGWTEKDNPDEKYVLKQHTEWKRIDEVWFPTSVKWRRECEHLNIDESAQFELISASFTEPPSLEIFDPQNTTQAKIPFGQIDSPNKAPQAENGGGNRGKAQTSGTDHQRDTANVVDPQCQLKAQVIFVADAAHHLLDEVDGLPSEEVRERVELARFVQEAFFHPPTTIDGTRQATKNLPSAATSKMLSRLIDRQLIEIGPPVLVETAKTKVVPITLGSLRPNDTGWQKMQMQIRCKDAIDGRPGFRLQVPKEPEPGEDLPAVPETIGGVIHFQVDETAIAPWYFHWLNSANREQFRKRVGGEQFLLFHLHEAQRANTR